MKNKVSKLALAIAFLTYTLIPNNAQAQSVKKRLVSFLGSTVVSIPAIGDMGGAWFAQAGDLTKSGVYTCTVTIANVGTQTQDISDFQFRGLKHTVTNNNLSQFDPERAVLLKDSANPVTCSNVNASTTCRRMPAGSILTLMTRLYVPMTGLGHTVIAPCSGSFYASNELDGSGNEVVPGSVGTLIASGSISYASDVTAMMFEGTGNLEYWSSTSSENGIGVVSGFRAPVRGYTTGTTTFEINGSKPF